MGRTLDGPLPVSWIGMFLWLNMVMLHNGYSAMSKYRVPYSIYFGLACRNIVNSANGLM